MARTFFTSENGGRTLLWAVRSSRQILYKGIRSFILVPWMQSTNPGRFGPIPVRSGRFGLISGVSRFGPVRAGRFCPIS